MFQRPTSITVLAIIGLFFALFGILCTPFSVIQMMTDGASVPLLMPGAQGQEIEFPQSLTNLMILSVAVGFVGSLFLLIGSITSFKMNPVARPCMNAYAAISIVNSVITTVAQLYVLAPSMAEMVASTMPEAPRGAIVAGIFLGGLLAMTCPLAYPVFVLVFYNKKSNREAFANRGMVGAPPGYGGYYPDPAQQQGYGYPPQQGYPPHASPESYGQQPPYPPPPQQQPPEPGRGREGKQPWEED